MGTFVSRVMNMKDLFFARRMFEKYGVPRALFSRALCVHSYIITDTHILGAPLIDFTSLAVMVLCVFATGRIKNKQSRST